MPNFSSQYSYYAEEKNNNDYAFFCRHCHKKSLHHQDDIFFTHCDIDHAMTCEHCQQETPPELIRHASYSYSSYYQDRFMHEIKGDKLRLFIKSSRVTLFNGKIQVTYYMTLAVFNFSTGRSYAMRPVLSNTKQRPLISRIPRVMNVTHSGTSKHYLSETSDLKFSVDDPEQLALINVVEELMEKRLGYMPAFFTPGSHEILTESRHSYFSLVQLIALYNRYPNLSMENRLAVKRLSDNESKMLRFFHGISADSSDPIKDLMAKLRIPFAKSIRKLALKDISVLFRYYGLERFRDVNLIRSILTATPEERGRLFVPHIRPTVSPITTQGKEAESLRSFIKALIHHNGETVAANKISQVRGYIVMDTANMYKKITETFPDYYVNFSQSIKEMHDDMVVDYKRVRHSNRDISYRFDPAEHELVSHGIQFEFAKQTFDLVETGTRMNICVGSYADNAYEGNTIIVIGYENDEPVLCLEMDNKFKRIVQAKRPRNRRPEGDYFDATMAFVAKNELTVKTYDLEETIQQLERQDEEVIYNFA